MKAEGIVRGIDSAGRIVLPRDVRERMGLNQSTAAVEIFTEGDKIILKKYAPCCRFCSNADDLVEFHGEKICRECLKEISEL